MTTTSGNPETPSIDIDKLPTIPKEWNIWLEANSKDIEDIENVWKKCGFTYYTTIKGSFFGDKIIYKRKN